MAILMREFIMVNAFTPVSAGGLTPYSSDNFD